MRTKNGKLIITLPMNMLEYKIIGGKDDRFVVNINAKHNTNFQEISDNKTRVHKKYDIKYRKQYFKGWS
jgi:hypothetical protein